MAPLLRLVTLVVSLASSLWVDAYAITGVTGGINTKTGQRPSRQDLRTFSASGPAWDLYIQALIQLQAVDQNELLSYYQVAGIHGYPIKSWDGVSGSYNSGYCTHSSIIFPTWHRPYLALYEQLLYENCQNIANSYPNASRAQYKQAALTFRIPYWDWSLSAPMPSVLNTANITINTPSGKSSVANPLVAYTFHPIPTSDFPASDGPIARYPTTVRYPDGNGRSQPDLVNQQLQANAGSLHDSIYLLLARSSSYAPFSNTAWQTSGGHDSLENQHNGIHGLVGNGGHMSYVPYSAFDPIFWLHHTNVDRIFAIWQAIYPRSWVVSQANRPGTFTTAPGAIENAQTPLTPFHSDNSNTLYNSNTARYTKHFGYTYPEVVDWGLSSSQVSANTKATIKALYDPNNSIGARDESSIQARDYNSIPNYREWFANVVVDKYALGKSFFCHVFLGDFEDDPKKWSFSPALVSSYVVFTAAITGPREPLLVYGQIPLNRKLIAAYKAGIIKDLSEESVVPYLTKYLQWRLQLNDDSPVSVDEAGPSFKIGVVSQSVKASDSPTEFPVYGNSTPHNDPTKDKKGGAATPPTKLRFART